MRTGFDMAQFVTQLLTPHTTRALPEPWRGRYSADRARRWLAERDAESMVLLVSDTEDGDGIGLVIVSPRATPEGALESDLRFGYILRESVWGWGLATELVAGLVNWAQNQRGILTLAAGTDAANHASRRVLVKNGFHASEPASPGEMTYRLRLADSPT